MARPNPVAALLLAFLAPAAGVACSKSEAPPVDSANEARIIELERKLSELTQAKDGAGLAAGVSNSELANRDRTIRELSERVKALEERQPAGATPGMASDAAAGSSGSSGPGTTPLPATFQPGSDGTFTEEQLTAFRKIADEVQKRKDAEALADRVKRELARAGINLPPDQEAAVLKLQQTYREKMQEVFRNGFGSTEADRQAAMDKRDALRTQFETELRSVVPTADADKIVEAMRRGWPGFFPRRQDGAGSGMGGGRGSLPGG